MSYELLYRPYHEDRRVPHHVGNKDGHESAGDCIKPAPEGAAGQGRQDENRVSRGQMDGDIEKGRDEPCRQGRPFYAESTLHKTPPEDLLPEADGKEKENPHDKGRENASVGVDGVDVPRPIRDECGKKAG